MCLLFKLPSSDTLSGSGEKLSHKIWKKKTGKQGLQNNHSFKRIMKIYHPLNDTPLKNVQRKKFKTIHHHNHNPSVQKHKTAKVKKYFLSHLKTIHISEKKSTIKVHVPFFFNTPRSQFIMTHQNHCLKHWRSSFFFWPWASFLLWTKSKQNRLNDLNDINTDYFQDLTDLIGLLQPLSQLTSSAGVANKTSICSSYKMMSSWNVTLVFLLLSFNIQLICGNKKYKTSCTT